MNLFKWLTAVLIVTVVSVLASTETENNNQVEQDKAVPAIELTDLITGEAIQFDLIEGSFMLNIWGSWCVACAREHDFLLKLQESGVRIIGISYMDSANNALEWLNKKGNPYARSLIDSEGKLGEALGIKGAPETYLIDSAGRIRYKHIGILNEENWPSVAERFKQLQ